MSQSAISGPAFEACAPCGVSSDLRASHVIPKLVYRRFRETLSLLALSDGAAIRRANRVHAVRTRQGPGAPVPARSSPATAPSDRPYPSRCPPPPVLGSPFRAAWLKDRRTSCARPSQTPHRPAGCQRRAICGGAFRSRVRASSWASIARHNRRGTRARTSALSGPSGPSRELCSLAAGRTSPALRAAHPRPSVRQAHRASA